METAIVFKGDSKIHALLRVLILVLAVVLLIKHR